MVKMIRNTDGGQWPDVPRTASCHDGRVGESLPQGPPPDPLLDACRALGEAMARFDESACRALGVGRTDLRALNLLEHGPLTAGEIAVRLGLTTGSVTTLVDRLVRAGYVGRETDEGDRRRVLVGLQPATYAAFARVYAPLGVRVHGVGQGFPAGQRQRATEVMRAMTAAFDAARPARAPGGVDGSAV
jgi:DNA-binding MarR family transcriptional regulator